ncbi:MAG: FMN-binding protein [Planctomycetes bacterium]|nr:FMN-binding protein [Planctomycetota bacterium]
MAATKHAPILLTLALPLLLAADAACGAQPASPAPNRTKAEVDALIQKDGGTQPDWWNAVQLNYPKTLDLSMNPPATKGWDPSKNVGQYFWSIINENSSKWKEGVRFAAHLMTVNKDEPNKVNQAMGQMAHLYADCLEDYTRAAYWLLKKGDTADERLAVCYWKLGCKDAAKEILTKYGVDDTRHGSIVKLWADMGEYDTALKVADEKSKNGAADIAYLMAGDTCRLAGKYKEALDFYQKALNVQPNDAGRDIKQTKGRAQASLDAVKLYETLDLKKVADGVYKSSSQGYTGQVFVEVSVKSGTIADVKVVQHTEKQYYGSIAETPRKIIAKQSVKGIDTFASATITSEAIVNATAKALASGMK